MRIQGSLLQDVALSLWRRMFRSRESVPATVSYAERCWLASSSAQASLRFKSSSSCLELDLDAFD